MALFSLLFVLFVALPTCFSIYYEGEEFSQRGPKELTSPEYDRPVYAIFTSAEEYDKYTSILEDAGIRALDTEEGSLPELKVIISDGDIHDGLRVAGFFGNIYPSLAAMITMFVTSALKIPWLLLGQGANSTTTTTAAPVIKQDTPRAARYIHFSNEDAYNPDIIPGSLPIDPLPLPSTPNNKHQDTLLDLLVGDYPSSTHSKTYHLPSSERDFHFSTKLPAQSPYDRYETAPREPLTVPVPVLFLLPYPVPYPTAFHLETEPRKNVCPHTDDNFPVRVALNTEKNETIPATSTLNITNQTHK